MIGLIALAVSATAFIIWFKRKWDDPLRHKRRMCEKRGAHSMVEQLPAPNLTRERLQHFDPLTGLVHGLLNAVDLESHSVCEYGCGEIGLFVDPEWVSVRGSWDGSVAVVAFDSNVVSIMERMRA